MFDLLFTNADLVTMSMETAGPPGIDAVGVRSDRIAAVGTTAELTAAAGPDARRIDLAGAALLPAFADPHIHLWKVGQLESSIADLRNAESLADVRQGLATRADGLRPDDWLLARGVNEQRLAEGRLPSRAELDAWCGDRPVLVTRACAHIAVANSAALARSGVTADTPDVEGGEIRRDAEGHPTGVVTETAISLIQAAVPPPTAADQRGWIATALQRKLAQGCASATDPGVDDGLQSVYHSMADADELPLRCHVMRLGGEEPPAAAHEILAPQVSDCLVTDTVKFFLDGGLSGATAAISQDYNQGGRGVLRMDAERFAACAEPYAKAGYAVAAHAIGDVAIDAGLTAFKSLPAGRQRLEHLGLPSAEALRRATKAGVMIATQPAFLPELGANFNAYLPDTFPITPYPFRSMIDAGLTVAFSSDAPVVVDDSPLAGIAAAATRTGRPDSEASERVSIRQALHAYTLAAARVEGVESMRGSLESGKLADLVVLDQNPLKTPLNDLLSIRVLATYVGGRLAYER